MLFTGWHLIKLHTQREALLMWQAVDRFFSLVKVANLGITMTNIRLANLEDCSAINLLSSSLGYQPLSADEALHNLRALLDSDIDKVCALHQHRSAKSVE